MKTHLITKYVVALNQEYAIDTPIDNERVFNDYTKAVHMATYLCDGNFRKLHVFKVTYKIKDPVVTDCQVVI